MSLILRNSTNNTPLVAPRYPADSFLHGVLGGYQQIIHSSRFDLAGTDLGFESSTTSLMLRAIHQATTDNLGLALRPEVLWCMILESVAEYLRQNADISDYPFDTQRFKQIAEHFSPSWKALGEGFYGRLVDAPGAHAGKLFVPSFSTATHPDYMSLLMSFMDVAGTGHGYQAPTTKAHIPAIKLMGTRKDWRLLWDRVNALRAQQPFADLEDYFENLCDVLHTIYCTIAGFEINVGDFWESMYKLTSRAEGSYVTGWITAFFAFIQTPQGATIRTNYDWSGALGGEQSGITTHGLPSHVASIQFVRSHSGVRGDRTMRLASGILGIDWHVDEKTNQGFLCPRLGYAIVEI